jgi:hypothetical protein
MKFERKRYWGIKSFQELFGICKIRMKRGILICSSVPMTTKVNSYAIARNQDNALGKLTCHEGLQKTGSGTSGYSWGFFMSTVDRFYLFTLFTLYWCELTVLRHKSPHGVRWKGCPDLHPGMRGWLSCVRLASCLFTRPLHF